MRSRWVHGRPTIAARRAALALVAAALAVMGLTSGILAMDEVTLQGCDEAVDASFATAYDSFSGAYLVEAVVISGVTATCDGMTFSITLADGTNSMLGHAIYIDPAGPDGQVDPLLGNRQVVRLDMTGQRVRASAVVLVAAQIAS